MPLSHTHVLPLNKEETDNTPTDKIEQVTFGVKQGLSFEMLSFFKKFKTINTVLWLFNVFIYLTHKINMNEPQNVFYFNCEWKT